MAWVLKKEARLIIHRMIDQFADGNEIQEAIKHLSVENYAFDASEGNLQDSRVLAKRLENAGYLEAAQYLCSIMPK